VGTEDVKGGIAGDNAIEVRKMVVNHPHPHLFEKEKRKEEKPCPGRERKKGKKGT
jgi:hypothetical protein